jgi:hypothetical protein
MVPIQVYYKKQGRDDGEGALIMEKGLFKERERKHAQDNNRPPDQGNKGLTLGSD